MVKARWEKKGGHIWLTFFFFSHQNWACMGELGCREEEFPALRIAMPLVLFEERKEEEK